MCVHDSMMGQMVLHAALNDYICDYVFDALNEFIYQRLQKSQMKFNEWFEINEARRS